MGTGDFSLHLRKLARGAGVVGALAKQLRLGRGEKKLKFRGTTQMSVSIMAYRYVVRR